MCNISRTKHAVVILGGGPPGLMLAGALALAGVDVAVVEWRRSQDLTGGRAADLHSRTIEILDQRGIAGRERILAAWVAELPVTISLIRKAAGIEFPADGS